MDDTFCPGHIGIYSPQRATRSPSSGRAWPPAGWESPRTSSVQTENPRGTRPQAASSSSRDPAVLLPQPPVCSLMRPGALFPLLPCTFKLKSFLILNLGIVARIVQRAAMHHPPALVPRCYRLLAVGRCHAEIRSLVHAATSGFCSHVPFAVLQFHPGPHVVVLAPASPTFWDQLSDFAHVLGTWGCVQ